MRNSPPLSPRNERGGAPAGSRALGPPPCPGGRGGGKGKGGVPVVSGAVIPPMVPRMIVKYPKFSGREDEDADAHILSFEMAWMVNSAPLVQASNLMKMATFIPTLHAEAGSGMDHAIWHDSFCHV